MRLFGRGKQAVDPDARSPETGLKLKDAAVLAALRKNGADLTQPLHVIYYVFAPSAAAAEAVAADAMDHGFVATVTAPLPDYPDTWAVACDTTDVVSDLLVRSNGDFFEQLAAAHGADYDGWEASVR